MILLRFLSNINSSFDLIFVICRAFIIYLYVVLLLRFSNSRFQLKTPLDMTFLIVLGSLVIQGVYGRATLISAFAASFSLFICHRLLAVLAERNKLISTLVKGKSHIIILNGVVNADVLKKCHITEDELIAECRSQLKKGDLAVVKEGRIEKNGNITLI